MIICFEWRKSFRELVSGCGKFNSDHVTTIRKLGEIWSLPTTSAATRLLKHYDKSAMQLCILPSYVEVRL
jgi:hypothetical protein